MRRFVLLLGLVVFFGCARKELPSVNIHDVHKPFVVSDQAQVEVTLAERDVARYATAEDALWEEGRKAGLHAVFIKLLEREAIFVPVNIVDSAYDHQPWFTEQGAVTLTADAETGDLSQRFWFCVRFVGDNTSGGEIVSLEDSHYISGATDMLYGLFYQKMPDSLPAYVGIAEPMSEMRDTTYRLIGFAEVKQQFDTSVRQATKRSTHKGSLCSLQVIQSSREIEPGDRFFLINVVGRTLAPEEVYEPVLESSASGAVPFQPVRDTVTEPTENK